MQQKSCFDTMSIYFILGVVAAISFVILLPIYNFRDMFVVYEENEIYVVPHWCDSVGLCTKLSVENALNWSTTDYWKNHSEKNDDRCESSISCSGSPIAVCTAQCEYILCRGDLNPHEEKQNWKKIEDVKNHCIEVF